MQRDLAIYKNKGNPLNKDRRETTQYNFSKCQKRENVGEQAFIFADLSKIS